MAGGRPSCAHGDGVPIVLWTLEEDGTVRCRSQTTICAPLLRRGGGGEVAARTVVRHRLGCQLTYKSALKQGTFHRPAILVDSSTNRF